MEEINAEKRLSFPLKVKYFFIKPSMVYSAYIEKPTWFLKTLFMSVIMGLFMVITMYVSKDLSMELMLQKAGQMTPEQLAGAEKILYSPVAYLLYGLLGVVVTFFTVLVVSLVILGMLKMFGNQGKFRKVIAVYSLAYIPMAIGSMLKGGYMFITNKPVFADLQPTFMSTALNQLDLFLLWYSILLVIGLNKVLGLEEKKGIIIAVVLWLISFGMALLPLLTTPKV